MNDAIGSPIQPPAIGSPIQPPAIGSPIQPPVRSSFPIHFRLEDSDGNNAIYITEDDAEDRHLVIVLTNRSGEPIRLGPVGPHFELRFRKGVLSEKTLERLPSGVLAAEPDWTVTRDDYAEELALKFTCKNPKSAGDGGVLKPEGPLSSLSLALKHITADPTGGVYTTQVGFSPRQLFYGETDGKVLVTGFRTQRLHVLSHLGKPHIPLHVGLVDDKIDGAVARQTLLNDGATINCLCVRITNLQQNQPLKLNPQGSRTPTTLTLTIPTGEESQPWAMMSSDDAKKIFPILRDAKQIPPTTNKTGWEPMEKGDRKLGGGTAYVFKFVPSSKTTELVANQSFDVLLTNIKTKAAPGQATLLVEYGNFPGYWSGRFDIPVHKAPLLFSGTNVGILTPDPTSPLSITSNTNVSAFYVKQAGTGAAASFVGRVGINEGGASNRDDAPTFYVKQAGKGAAASFVGKVEVTSTDPASPTVRIDAESGDNALSVKQRSGGRAAHFEGPVKIINAAAPSGQAGLNIDIVETNNAPALVVRSKNPYGAGYFVGRVYIGDREPDKGVLTFDNSLYIEPIGQGTPLIVSSAGPSSDAAVFHGNVIVDGTLETGHVSVGGRLNARLPNWVSKWQQDHSNTYHTTEFPHGLGYLPAVVMLYFSPTDPATKVYPVCWQLYGSNVANWNPNPTAVEVTTEKVVLHIAGGGDLYLLNLLDTTAKTGGPYVHHKQGYWRVVLFGRQE